MLNPEERKVGDHIWVLLQVVSLFRLVAEH
jgi:hypothetical protein